MIPSRWGDLLLVLLQKSKSEEFYASDSQPIAWSCMFRRIFEKVLLPAFTDEPDESLRLHPAQAGFSRGFSCQTAALLANRYARAVGGTFAVHLDFEKAFDSPRPHVVQRGFLDRGVPEDLRRLVWALQTTGSAAAVVVNGKKSRQFARARNAGFAQRCVSSPLLFNLFIDPLVLFDENSLGRSPPTEAQSLTSFSTPTPVASKPATGKMLRRASVEPRFGRRGTGCASTFRSAARS